jgi:hypothetical protein
MGNRSDAALEMTDPRHSTPVVRESMQAANSLVPIAAVDFLARQQLRQQLLLELLPRLRPTKRSEHSLLDVDRGLGNGHVELADH